MKKLRFTAGINAPVHTVWTTMLDEASYREWTKAFMDGSYYEGSWEAGSEIRFFGPNEDGSVDGLVGRVIENRPDEFVCVEFLGQVAGGVVDTTSEEAKQIAGAQEAYSFSESGGATTLEVVLDSEEEYADVLNERWPKALARLKALAEEAS
jgi:uncharacterized protein YndB with AHSA1/START domain